MTDPAEEIPEKIKILNAELNCHMCVGKKETFTTTIILCNKCRRSLMKSILVI